MCPSKLFNQLAASTTKLDGDVVIIVVIGTVIAQLIPREHNCHFESRPHQQAIDQTLNWMPDIHNLMIVELRCLGSKVIQLV